MGSADSPSPGEVVKAITYEFSPIGEYCLVPGYAPTDLSAATKFDTDGTGTMKGCADRCTAENNCRSWAFIGEGPGLTDHGCYDITPTSPEYPGSAPLTYRNDASNPMTGLAGPCPCPSTPAGGGPLTGETFPPEDTASYQDLFASSKHQPAPLACWPKDETGHLKAAEAVVQRTNIDNDESDPKYFKGWCSGMTPHALDTPGSDCRTSCVNDPQCNGYQSVPEGSSRTAGCFFGAGYDCDADQADLAGMKAERFARGYVNVIAKLTKYRVMGLTQRFDETMYTCPAAEVAPAPPPAADAPAPPPAADDTAVATDGGATDDTAGDATADDASAGGRRLLNCAPGETDWAELAIRCKEVCVSDIWCSVWQVYNGNDQDAAGNHKGCFTEAQGDLNYPLTRSNVVQDPTGIQDGEFLQHWYSQDITTTTTTTTSPPPPNRLLPILLGVSGLVALVGLGAYAMGWCSPKEKPKVRAKKRAVQQAPEPPKEEPVPAQPSFLMQAPVLTYSAAPVTYAAPVATAAYAAAPMTYAAAPAAASYQVVQAPTTMPYSTSVVVPQEPMMTGFMG